MKKMFYAAALLLAQSAGATEVTIQDSRCVSASAKRVHEYVTDYDRYSSSPGAAYELNLGAFGKTRLLEMVKSQSKYTIRESNRTDGFVWVVLRPLALDNQAYYPRFLLRCESSASSRGYTHSCRLRADKQHYGLKDFRSNLEIAENDLRCAAGQTRLDYTLALTSEPAEVEALKAETLKPAGALAPVLGKLFDEKAFFQDYYKNFYEGWMKDLAR